MESLPQVVAVLGAQFGDEGKGKLVDILSKERDVCCRFNGGANAGHSLVVDGKTYAFHLLPCGILYPSCRNVIGNGVVLHIETLMKELEQLEDTDKNAVSRLFISTRAHLVFGFHMKADAEIEQRLSSSNSNVGTTKRGIGPCYATKAFRSGIRAGELLNFEKFSENYMKLFQEMSRGFDLKDYDYKTELVNHREYSKKLMSQIIDVTYMLQQWVKDGSKILVEGANAAMLDLDFGTYPFVTSSSTCAGGISTGLGLPPRSIQFIAGVVKAYTSRVGAGPFPTELFDEVGEHLQKVGHEFGTTTARPRRCGWLDVPMLRYSNALNGFDAINLTKLDVLSGLMEVKVAVSYSLDGKKLPSGAYPSESHDLFRLEVHYETYPGWEEDLSTIHSFDSLPPNAKRYIRRLEELLEVPIRWVGVGPDRENTIVVPSNQ